MRADRIRKSLGSENTFPQDLVAVADLVAALEEPLDRIAAYLARGGAPGRTLTLKIKYADFRQIMRSRTVAPCFQDRAELAEAARALLEGAFSRCRSACACSALPCRGSCRPRAARAEQLGLGLAAVAGGSVPSIAGGGNEAGDRTMRRAKSGPGSVPSGFPEGE